MNAELFECESMMEFVVAPGEEFTKDWCFSNTGSYAFPAGPTGVELKLTEGDHQLPRWAIDYKPISHVV